MKYAIETDSLTKKYGDFIAVNDLNMKIKNKTIFGFLGPNGAGKTTSIKMLNCLIESTSGTATVGGHDIIKEPNEVRNKIGMVPQLVSLYGDLTAKENVELCADYYGLTEDEKEERIPELMELVDIKYAENKFVKQMSGGQKQKVSVVASLIHKPDILFLDEPTIGLDPTTKTVLWELISELNDNGHTIILCSHDMYEVEMLCENVGIMSSGELVAFDTPQRLKDTLLHKNKEELLETMGNLSSEKEFSKITTPMFKKDINNHSPEYLAEVKKYSKDISILINKFDDNNVNVNNNNVNINDNSVNDNDSNININDSDINDNNINVNDSDVNNNIYDNIIEDIKKLDIVYHVTSNKTHDGTRLTIAADKFVENGVSQIIKIIIKNNIDIVSINTKDPSLEDVFVDVTAK